MSVQSRINLGYSWIPATTLLVLLLVAWIFSGLAIYDRFTAKAAPPCEQKAVFAPQPDITAYELAQMQSKVASLGMQVCVTMSNPIPAEMARHFRMVPQ